MLHMLLHRVAIDQNVIHAYNHKIIKPLSENVVHECAKCGKCIGEIHLDARHLYNPSQYIFVLPNTIV
jgi:hypothetical protein